MKAHDDVTKTPGAEATTAKPSELRNSLWVTDKAGKTGLIDSISGSDALIRHRTAKEGDVEAHFGELTRVPLVELTQAAAADLPEGHGMAPAELEALGYR